MRETKPNEALIARIRQMHSDARLRTLAQRRLMTFRRHFRKCREDPARFAADPSGIDRFVEDARIMREAFPDGAWPEFIRVIDEIEDIARETRATRLHMTVPAVRPAA
jgi:hypothetical protein